MNNEQPIVICPTCGASWSLWQSGRRIYKCQLCNLSTTYHFHIDVKDRREPYWSDANRQWVWSDPKHRKYSGSNVISVNGQ